ncbi:DUF3099 domain-containing protein [Streptomyces sp. IBSBF 2953]|uniref:DUF3099 domain-containing protein n=1 Tax=Streptomyces TaxID=1883 RepID=UPI002119E6FA|nr:DUF3099 domain-containing protein [Streptomyces scabiei]MCQ9180859.1 DUF3099 domain-containing protein [Streptomyces hayashii]MDX3112988.1 DUF3099 domain-containing protein [Streptomyces scabiei]
MRKQGGGGNVEVFRITGARQGLQDDVRGRQRRYIISMSVRTVAVILAATLWNVERHVAVVALVLGLVLPYVAVVIANAGRENVPSLPSTFIAAPIRPMIARSGVDEEPPGSAPQAESDPLKEGSRGAGRAESAADSAERRP